MQILRFAPDDEGGAPLRMTDKILPMIGRVVAFAAMLVVCSTAALALLAPLAAKVISSTGQPFKLDVFPNLIAVFVATALMLRSIDRRPWTALDLGRMAAQPRLFARGFLLGGVAIVAVCGVLWVTRMLVVRSAPAGTSWLSAALRTSLVLAPAALTEEVMCRGYLLTVIRDCVGVRGAIVLTSVLFGLLHVANPDATPESVFVVIVAGMFLAAVRVALKSLYAAWMAHFAWNWIMAVPLHASVSGIRFEAPGYFADTAGPQWLSGGSWGPEGGIVAALGLIAVFGYLYSRYIREES